MYMTNQADIDHLIELPTMSKGSDQSAHTRSLVRAFASLVNILWLLGY